jgi:hypothetical protein
MNEDEPISNPDDILAGEVIEGVEVAPDPDDALAVAKEEAAIKDDEVEIMCYLIYV